MNRKMWILPMMVIFLAYGCDKDDKEVTVIENPIDRYEYNLESKGYPVARASDGASYVPGQFVFDFSMYDDDQKQRLQDSISTVFGPSRMLKDCGCLYDIELWEIDNLKANENEKSGKDQIAESLGHEEVESNLYVLPDRVRDLDLLNESFSNLPVNFTVIPTSNNAVVIALMDTGLDYTYQDDIVNGEPMLPLWENPNETLDRQDNNDPFCYVDDVIGWDFVNNDNDPMDDHSHGTHIAGHIAELLRENAPDVKFKFMALKILDENGVGNSFNAICASYYIAEMKASVANASWGYYGASREVLSSAIRKAQISGGANIMCSSGNDGVAIAEDHYPGSWFNDHKGIVSWGYLEEDEMTFASESNYFLPPTVNIASPGTNIKSIVPKHLIGQVSTVKSGSSISTARNAAVTMARKFWFPNFSPVQTRNQLTTLLANQSSVQDFVRNGDTVQFIPVLWVD